MQVSYYSLLPRLTHLAFGMLGSCAIQNPASAEKLLVNATPYVDALGAVLVGLSWHDESHSTKGILLVAVLAERQDTTYIRL